MRSLVWFRSDLRTTDNPALAHAAAHGQVVAVFVICPKQWRSHDWGANKASFVLQNVAALREALGKLNMPLRIVQVDWFRDVPRRLLNLAKQTGCDALHSNAEHEINEQRRDERVQATFEKAGLAVGRWPEQTVVAPGSLKTQAGKPYTVFTPFRRAWLKHVKETGYRVRPEPARQPPLHLHADPVPDRVPGFDTSTIADAHWPAGQRHAEQRLEQFVEQRLAGYAKQRDLPAEPGTSELSPYLACGAISARQCLKAAATFNRDRLDRGREGPIAWISELIWREFYRHILVSFPRVSMRQPFDRVMDGVGWRYDEAAFERWATGRTGVPLVDAGMRQLRAIGWMHNRLRMVTAMYLTKHLLIDWRWGEQLFMAHLVDGDLASNNGGWQWAASTGTDSVPYFRIFNPTRQGERFDPRGAFVRQWCPELADIPAARIHDPAKWSDDQRRAADWPEPMVDHRAARQRALAAFKKARQGGG